MSHGRRRGLRPLRRRLTKHQWLVRLEHIEWRKEMRAMAKLVARRTARKGAHK